MKTLAWFCLLVWAARLVLAAGPAAEETAGFDLLPSAPAGTNFPPAAALSATGLLDATVATLPREPLTLKGMLTVRRQRGQVIKEVPFAIHLDWGATPPCASYEMRDTFGRSLERLTVTRRDGKAELQLEQGDGTPAVVPSLAAHVQGTDLTWLDLTLSFLWWRDARLEEPATLRGRLCDVVVATPPDPLPGCAGMRLWIDRQLRFLMQAEQLGPQGEPVRRMWVRSVRKIDDRWIIRDMEIENVRSDHRTRLRVEDLDAP